MSRLQTTVKPCIRFVLVRNAQCQKHLSQQKGDFSNALTNGVSILTDQGKKMAESLGNIISYLNKKPFCTPNVPDKYYHVVIDDRAPQHNDTAGHINATDNGVNVIVSSNVYNDMTNLNYIHKHPNDMDIYIVFTDGNTIRDLLETYVGIKNVGPALGSTTIFDYIPSESYENQVFTHSVGSLEALHWGGFDTTKIFWWNNAP